MYEAGTIEGTLCHNHERREISKTDLPFESKFSAVPRKDDNDNGYSDGYIDENMDCDCDNDDDAAQARGRSTQSKYDLVSER